MKEFNVLGKNYPEHINEWAKTSPIIFNSGYVHVLAHCIYFTYLFIGFLCCLLHFYEGCTMLSW